MTLIHHRPFATAAVIGLLAAPLQAQPLDMGEAADEAIGTLQDQASEVLLVGDLIGSTIDGPSGEPAGEITNLVAVPGGNLVAVLVTPMDGGAPIAVPYRAVKISRGAEELDVALPGTLADLRVSDAVTRLGSELGDLIADQREGP